MSDDSLNIEDHPQLAEYLRRRDRSLIPVHFQTLAGGVSNRTVRVRFENGDAWVIKQALAKLRTKADWFSDPARVHREALGMRWLSKLVPGSVPEFVFEDFDHHLLAMRAVPEPRENWKTVLMSADPWRIEPNHFQQFGTLLGTIHRNAVPQSDQLSQIFDDRSFFESLRIEPYYEYTAQQIPQAADFLQALIADTRTRRHTLVHGDYSPKNILVHEGRLVLLDHEVIHWGDPAFDVGFAMAHFYGKAVHRPKGAKVFVVGAMCFFTAYTAVTISRDPVPEWAIGPVSAQLELRHSIACVLARAAGRSPLEYLHEKQRRVCIDNMLQAIKSPPRYLNRLMATALNS